MDVTPQLIEQIDFAEKFRGYDPDQVDDFLERVGATIAELDKGLRDATERAARAEAELAARPEGAGRAAPMTDEEEALQSTRTLMMAKRTADAAIADAREEAARLVSDAESAAQQQAREAQTEADRIIGEARVTADQMTQKATAEANREYGARRDQILAEIGELENRKQGMVAQLAAVEDRLGEYRDGLTTIHRAVGAVLEDPTAALRSPLPGIDLDAARAASAPAPEPEPVVVEPEPTYAEAAVITPAPAPEPAPVEPAFSEPAFSEPAFAEPAFAEPVADTDSDAAFGSATLLDPADLAVPYSEAPFAEAPLTEAVATDDAWDTESPAGDPWGPGSWNDVAAAEPDPAFTEPAFSEPAFTEPAFSDQGFADQGFADQGFGDQAFGGQAFGDPSPFGADAGAGQAFSDFPSDGLPVIGQDRYTRDLDQAVNRAEGEQDDALAAFFEGDDEQQTRRFGRRR